MSEGAWGSTLPLCPSSSTQFTSDFPTQASMQQAGNEKYEHLPNLAYEGRDPLRIDLIDLLMDGQGQDPGPSISGKPEEANMEFNGVGLSFPLPPAFNFGEDINNSQQEVSRSSLPVPLGFRAASTGKHSHLELSKQENDLGAHTGSASTENCSLDFSRGVLSGETSECAMSVAHSFVSMESRFELAASIEDIYAGNILQDVTQDVTQQLKQDQTLSERQPSNPFYRKLHPQQPHGRCSPQFSHIQQRNSVRASKELHTSANPPTTEAIRKEQKRKSSRQDMNSNTVDIFHSDIPAVRGPDGMYACGFCDMKFKQTGNRKKHVEETHLRRKPFLCTICNSSFSRKHARDTHLRAVHEKLRPYECPYCHKLYKNRSDLNKHIRTVEKREKPFACTTCGRCFGERGKLRRHSAIHKKSVPNAMP